MISVIFIQFCITKKRGMLEKTLRADPILKHLLKKSILTPTQLDTLLIHLSTLGQRLELDKKVKMRDYRPVSKGAFLTTLKQAKRNLSKAVYTILLATYLGLIEEKLGLELTKVGELLVKIKEAEPSKEKVEKSIELIEMLITRIIGKL